MNQYDTFVYWISLGFVLAGLGGFAVGFVVADNRKKKEEAYSPTLRPDEFYKPSKV